MRALGVMVLVLAMTACGGGGEAAAPVTLQVMMADDWAQTDVVVDTVRAFEAAHEGVRVNVIARPFSQIVEEAQSAMDAGRPLDLFHGHAFASGAIALAEDLDHLYADGTIDAVAYFDGALQDVTWGDTRYGIPLDVNAMFLVLDDDVETPRTFDDVRALADQAAAEGRKGLTVSANSWEAYGWIRANGGEVVTVAADGTPTFHLDSPEVVEALDFLGGLVADDLAFGPLRRDVSTDAFELFSAGDTAMLTTGTWNVAALERDPAAPAHRSVPMPVGDAGDSGGTTLGGSSLTVGRGSAHVDLAVAFALALTSDDNGVRLALEEGRFPARPALYDHLDAAPGGDVLAQQLQSAQPMKLIAFPAADEAFAGALEQILTGRADAATALARAQAIAEEEADPS